MYFDLVRQVATVELQINDEDANPALLVAFVVTTALLVGGLKIGLSEYGQESRSLEFLLLLQ